MDSKLLLSISILVSNRIDTIRKCLESIKPILTSIPSELIVVDTVGEENSDGSLSVAKEYTDKIYHFDWCNDFAMARNTGVTPACGEWFMFMDDDEWFEDTSEIIAFFSSEEYRKYNSATYGIKAYVDKKGTYSMGRLQRMTRRTEATRFVGKIHEYLAPWEFPCKEFNSFVHHSGYVFETEEDKKKHAERNLSLLLPEFEQNPWNMHWRAQIIQEYLSLPEMWETADALCEETFNEGKRWYMTPECQWIFMVYVLLAEKKGEESEVIRRAELLKKNYPLVAIARLAISIMETKACFDTEAYEAGVAACVDVIGQNDFLKKNRQECLKQNVFSFSVYLEPEVIDRAMKYGIRCYLRCNKADKARQLQTMRMQQNNRPILSISLLVSNRKDTIRRCMDSVSPLLAMGSCELIAVDTVGEELSDGSLAIVKEYTNKIYHFDWCDDFSAARNIGLEQATGEWFMFLDDDEWFESVEEIKEFFLSGEYLEYSSATYQIRNYSNPEGTNYSMAVLARMVRRNSSTRFEGTIHEHFNKMYLPCKNFSDFVHHFGYAYATEEEKQEHLQRNQKLLKKELEKNPTDLRLRTQTALELATYDNQAALDFCKETFFLCSEEKANSDFQWQLSLVFCLYEALGVSGAVAETTYKEYKEKYGFSNMAETAVSYQMTRIYLLEGAYEKAYFYAKQYFQGYYYLTDHPDVYQEQMAADFAKYMAQNRYLEMLDFIAFCAWQSKCYEEAWEYYSVMPWDAAEYKNEDGLLKVFALAEEAWNIPKLYSVIKRVMGNASMKPVLGALMQQYPAIKQRIAATLAELSK